MRQLKYKTDFKAQNPDWDETQVYLSKFFAGIPGENLQVFDAGCGNGNYVIDENRKKIGWAIGLDVSQEFVEKNVCLDEIIVGSLESIPLQDSSIDVCVSLWVLEHIENPKKVFSEIARILKPGGYFLFATPNKNFWLLKLAQIVKSNAVNHIINKRLFGRNSEDIFKTYYLANKVPDLEGLLPEDIKGVELRYNFDPSYTSFNKATNMLTMLTHKFFSKLGFKFTYPHIIGVLQKR